MSGTLAPSKSTVYISNLPFSLTNSDLHQLLIKYGKVVRVTIIKDKTTRKSKGVAFALFIDRNEAHVCASNLNNTQMFGRTVRASIARDNGRAAEFIRRREYPNKSRCYECGEFGHLSYNCPRNALGDREPPPKKKKIRRPKANPSGRQLHDPDPEVTSDEEGEDSWLDTWSAAVNYQTELNSGQSSAPTSGRKKRVRPNAYFSDEEEELDE